mmetsp:Transcript_159752/g.512660  ORF Transcript_159752/g.512660 Transcript_159752/m.512660 type:complete len:248 (+) Transcript_159752:2404-3147(+)
MLLAQTASAFRTWVRSGPHGRVIRPRRLGPRSRVFLFLCSTTRREAPAMSSAIVGAKLARVASPAGTLPCTCVASGTIGDRMPRERCTWSTISRGAQRSPLAAMRRLNSHPLMIGSSPTAHKRTALCCTMCPITTPGTRPSKSTQRCPAPRPAAAGWPSAGSGPSTNLWPRAQSLPQSFGSAAVALQRRPAVPSPTTAAGSAWVSRGQSRTWTGAAPRASTAARSTLSTTARRPWWAAMAAVAASER